MRNDVPVALFGAIAGFMNQNRRKRMNAAVNILFHIAQIYWTGRSVGFQGFQLWSQWKKAIMVCPLRVLPLSAEAHQHKVVYRDTG